MGAAIVFVALSLGSASAYSAVADDDSAALIPTLLKAQAEGVATRADFSRAQLTYLGRDRVLAFNQWTGDHALWTFERDGLSKCDACLLYTSPSPRDGLLSRMPSSA